MEKVNVHDAKTRFSQLLARVENGEEITIAKAGKPVAKLVPIRETAPQRARGLFAGEFTVPEDFNAPLPGDILDEFYK